MSSPKTVPPPWESTAVAPNFHPYFSQLSVDRHEAKRNDEEESVTTDNRRLSQQPRQQHRPLSSEATFRRPRQQQLPSTVEPPDVPTTKRCPKAKNHRRRHVPVGPAGVWYEAQLHQKAKQQQQQQLQSAVANADDPQPERTEGMTIQARPTTTATIIPTTCSTNASSSSTSPSSTSSIKDVSSCPAWQRMQAALGIMTPAVSHCDNVAERYHWLRPHIPSHMVLLPELLLSSFQDGKQIDLRVNAPHSMIVLVHAVHSHSQHPYDWTVELVDETACTIRAWMEPRFVQKELEGSHYEPSSSLSSSSNHGGSLIRPGVCWQLQNVSMTIQEHDPMEMRDATTTTTTTTTSSMMNLTNTGVERILLVAEHNIIQSWGPGSASSSRHAHASDDDNDGGGDDDDDEGNDNRQRRNRRSSRRRRRIHQDVGNDDDKDKEQVEPIILSLHQSQRQQLPPVVQPEQRQQPPARQQPHEQEQHQQHHSSTSPRRHKRRKSKHDERRKPARRHELSDDDDEQPSLDHHRQRQPQRQSDASQTAVPDFSRFLAPSQVANSSKSLQQQSAMEIQPASVAADEDTGISASHKLDDGGSRDVHRSKRNERRETSGAKPKLSVKDVTPTTTSAAPLWLDESAAQDESLWALEDDDEDKDESTLPRASSQTKAAANSIDQDDRRCQDVRGDGVEMRTQEEEPMSQEAPATMNEVPTQLATDTPKSSNIASGLFDVTALEGMNVDELFQVDDDED